MGREDWEGGRQGGDTEVGREEREGGRQGGREGTVSAGGGWQVVEDRWWRTGGWWRAGGGGQVGGEGRWMRAGG
jgi:hypothetical protein